jgi:hypothetical protein
VEFGLSWLVVCMRSRAAGWPNVMLQFQRDTMHPSISLSWSSRRRSLHAFLLIPLSYVEQYSDSSLLCYVISPRSDSGCTHG